LSNRVTVVVGGHVTGFSFTWAQDQQAPNHWTLVVFDGAVDRTVFTSTRAEKTVNRLAGD